MAARASAVVIFGFSLGRAGGSGKRAASALRAKRLESTVWVKSYRARTPAGALVSTTLEQKKPEKVSWTGARASAIRTGS
jgi:hypothetical protein